MVEKASSPYTCALETMRARNFAVLNAPLNYSLQCDVNSRYNCEGCLSFHSVMSVLR